MGDYSFVPLLVFWVWRDCWEVAVLRIEWDDHPRCLFAVGRNGEWHVDVLFLHVVEPEWFL